MTAHQPYKSGAPYGVSDPSGAAPLRRPGSIRRTSTIDVDWPVGDVDGPLRARGRARDLFTPQNNAAPRVLAEDTMDVTGSSSRQVREIHLSRENDAAQGLIGARPGGDMRAKAAQMLPQEKAETTPLFLLLDDYTGASLVSGWAWSQWPAWNSWVKARTSGGQTEHRPPENICVGWQTGAHVYTRDDPTDPAVQTLTRNTPSLVNAADPIGWHELNVLESVNLRRARRMDLWLEEGALRLDLGFQDSGGAPDGSRVTVHEYRCAATVDLNDHRLTALAVEAGALPHGECVGAMPNAQALVGSSVTEFRKEVLTRLRGPIGCTHLNDVLRCLADAPALGKRLVEELKK